MKAVLKVAAALSTVVFLVFVAAAATAAAEKFTGFPRDFTAPRLAVLAAIASIVVAIDWILLGPKVALCCSVATVLATWAVVAPLGLVSLSLVQRAPFVGHAVLCTGVAMALFVLQYRNVCTIAVVISATIVFVMHSDASLTSQAGVVLTLLFLHRAAQQAVTMLFIDLWPDVTEVDPWSNEFQEQVDFFKASCMPWCRSYDFQLRVESVFRVGSPVSMESTASQRAATFSTALRATLHRR